MELLTFDEDEVSGTGRDKVHKFDFVPAAFFISGNKQNVQLPEPKISMRFDSAPYETYKKGSVFTSTRNTLTYDRSNPAINETAHHISDAQHHPENTVPTKAGWTIPGAPSVKPLHRIFYDRTAQAEPRHCSDGWLRNREPTPCVDEFGQHLLITGPGNVCEK